MTGGQEDSAGEESPPGAAPLTPSDEARVRGLLACLSQPRMPAAIGERIDAAIRAESIARASSTLGSVTESAGTTRWGPRIGWALGLTGLAAASIVGAVVMTAGGGAGPLTPQPAAASVVSMGTSGTNYRHGTLASQVRDRWLRVAPYRTVPPASATPSESVAEVDGTETATPPSPVTTVSADVPAVRDILATSFASTHDGVVTCLDRLAPDAEPLMIDLGTFRGTDQGPDTPAAVIAYAHPTPGALDIYVVDRSCALHQAGVLAHVMASPSAP